MCWRIPTMTAAAATRVMIVKWRMKHGSSSFCSSWSVFAITSHRPRFACSYRSAVTTQTVAYRLLARISTISITSAENIKLIF